MKDFLRKFEKTMVAITFAEAGESETARSIMKEDTLRKSDRPDSRDRTRPDNRKQLRAD